MWDEMELFQIADQRRRAEQCESWILSKKNRRWHESWQVRIFIWFSKALQHTSRLGNVRWNGAFPNHKWEKKAWILTVSGWFVAIPAQSNKHKEVHKPPSRMLLQPELRYDHQIPELQQRKRTHSTDTHLSFSALINQVYITIVLPHHKPRMQYPSYLAPKENTRHRSPAKLQYTRSSQMLLPPSLHLSSTCNYASAYNRAHSRLSWFTKYLLQHTRHLSFYARLSSLLLQSSLQRENIRVIRKERKTQHQNPEFGHTQGAIQKKTCKRLH